MGSIGNFANGPRPVDYTSLMKSLCSVEQMYEGIVYEILVEPIPPRQGSAFRYVLEELPSCPCTVPRKDTFHLNGSLKTRASRARKMQRKFQRYSERAYQAAKLIQKKYSQLNYQLSLVKSQRFQSEEARRNLKGHKKNINEIRLQLGIREDVEAAKEFCRKGPNGETIFCSSMKSCNTSSDSDSCGELETALLQGLGEDPTSQTQANTQPLSVDYMLNIAYRNRRFVQSTHINFSENRNPSYHSGGGSNFYEGDSDEYELEMPSAGAGGAVGDGPRRQQSVIQEEHVADDEVVQPETSFTEVFLLCM